MVENCFLYFIPILFRDIKYRYFFLRV